MTASLNRTDSYYCPLSTKKPVRRGSMLIDNDFARLFNKCSLLLLAKTVQFRLSVTACQSTMAQKRGLKPCYLVFVASLTRMICNILLIENLVCVLYDVDKSEYGNFSSLSPHPFHDV